MLSLPSSSGSLRLEIEYYARFFLKAIRSFLTFLAGLTELVKKSNIDAVSMATILHYKTKSIKEIRSYGLSKKIFKPNLF